MIKTLAGFFIAIAIWWGFIENGQLPAITDNCPNGRIVYLQKGHESDKAKLCAALQ